MIVEKREYISQANITERISDRTMLQYFRPTHIPTLSFSSFSFSSFSFSSSFFSSFSSSFSPKGVDATTF